MSSYFTSKIYVLLAEPRDGYLFEYNYNAGLATAKLKAYFFDYPAVAAGKAIEVTGGPDISGIRFLAVGI